MKLIVRTTSNFMLTFPVTGEEVPWNRPAVVTQQSGVDQQISCGQLKVLTRELLPMEASDEEFAKFWTSSEGNEDLAVESYVSTFTAATENETETKTEGETKSEGKSKSTDKK